MRQMICINALVGLLVYKANILGAAETALFLLFRRCFLDPLSRRNRTKSDRSILRALRRASHGFWSKLQPNLPDGLMRSKHSVERGQRYRDLGSSRFGILGTEWILDAIFLGTDGIHMRRS